MAKRLKMCALLAGDDELLFLSHLTSFDTDGNIERGNRFNLQDLSNDQCKSMFRFEKQDINRLKTVLHIPDRVVCRNRTVCPGTEALCILLRRLSYPNRLCDICTTFNRPDYELSYIINKMLTDIYDRHSFLFERLNQPWLSEENLQQFSRVVADKDVPLDNIWGFIDGTCRAICRPSHNQRLLYSGHKRVHALKFQSITTPNGMIANMYGPVEGRKHDAGMLRMSGLLPQLEQYMTGNQGQVYALYGDPAYPLSAHLMTPFRGAALTEEEKIFNKKMASVRITVEWSFRKIITLFAFLDYKKNIKLYLQPAAKYYLVGALLTNCHTCLYGSETGEFFGINPPLLEHYLQR